MPKCKSCNATISFIHTRNNKMLPVNPGSVTIVTADGHIHRGFIPHFVTCPDADKHRRKK